EEAVESVLAQTYEHFELIIVDDGSTDNSREILRHIEQRDPRIRVLYKENGEQASAWNLGFDESDGETVAFIDPDDLFVPDKLAVVVEAFRRNPRTGLVYHRYQSVNQKGEITGVPFPKEMERGWVAPQAAQRGGWGAGSVTSVISLRRELAE